MTSTVKTAARIALGGLVIALSIPQSQMIVFAQQARPVFSTIPFWPPDGVPPAEFAAKHFVYLDYRSQEYVVSYPETLNTGVPDNGRRVEFRIEGQFTVEPEVAAAVKREADGAIRYEYAIRNGSAAKRPLREFGLVTAIEDVSVTLSHPAWTTSTLPLPVSPPTSPGGPELRIRAGVGRVVTWRTDDAGSISPATVRSGFQVKSRFLPGITSCFGSSGITPVLPDRLPAQVQEQLARVLAPENNWKSCVTIGPKFNPDGGPSKDPIWVANDYRLALEKLRVLDQRVTGDSAFVQELTSILVAVSQSGQRIPIRFKSVPASALEKEIAEAVVLALSSE